MANGMRKVAILCGNGGIFLPHELERGADGANTGYAYPEMLVQLVKLIKAGERAAGARPVRPASAAVALRAAARNAGLGGAQVHPQAPRRDRLAMRSASRASSCRRKRSPKSSS